MFHPYRQECAVQLTLIIYCWSVDEEPIFYNALYNLLQTVISWSPLPLAFLRVVAVTAGCYSPVFSFTLFILLHLNFVQLFFLFEEHIAVKINVLFMSIQVQSQSFIWLWGFYFGYEDRINMWISKGFIQNQNPSSHFVIFIRFSNTIRAVIWSVWVYFLWDVSCCHGLFLQWHTWLLAL